MDRFHPVPDVPARAASWAEWLYFNGRAGSTKFYLTFLVGPVVESGRRIAGVRLQLDRDGQSSTYSDSAELDRAAVQTRAPDLTIGESHVRLTGREYRIVLDLPAERRGERITGEIVLEATPGRSLPPLQIRGAAGWITGYVVPVMSGSLRGAVRTGSETIPLDGGTGYHDHNWGFWEGVSWQWGQVHGDGLSFVFGRIRPPEDAADPDRIPGFLGVLGPEGPAGYATDVTIEEAIRFDGSESSRGSRAAPIDGRIVIRGQSAALDLKLELEVESATATRMQPGLFGSGLDFLQLRGRYRVAGRVSGRAIDFTAEGTAETFRGR
jgi:hypothetical protein